MTAIHDQSWKAATSALLIALLGHLLVFIAIILLLFWQVKTPLGISSEETPPDDGTELVFLTEILPPPPPEQKKEASPPPESAPVMQSPNFVRTSAEQDATPPTRETNLIGERDTSARSDATPTPGAEERPAFSGIENRSRSPQSFDDSFQDGEDIGKPGEGATGPGDDLLTQKATPAQESQEATEALSGAETPQPAQEEKTPPTEEFLKPEIVEQTLPETLPSEEIAALPEKQEPAEAQAAKPAQEPKIAGGGQGEFHTETRKTVLSGSISSAGIAALDVKNTALGRYQKTMFQEIERRWQEGNFQYRSHIVPGMISTRFLVSPDGSISGQRQLEMEGASQMQWGLVLRALKSAKIPAMPAEVRKELGGHDLELSITFNY